MRRLLTVLLSVAMLAGCGDRDAERQETTIPLQPTARFTLSEIGDALDGGGLDVVRDPQAALGQEVRPRPTDAGRFADRSGVELAVLVFEDATAARRAIPSVLEAPDFRDARAVTSAYNAVAVLAKPPRRGAARQVWQVFRQLRIAGAREVSLTELLRQREALLGASVLVRGEIARRLPDGSRRPRAVTLRGPRGARILVVPARGQRLDLSPADEVAVRGMLVRVGRPGAGTGTNGSLARRIGDPAILADTVAAG